MNTALPRRHFLTAGAMRFSVLHPTRWASTVEEKIIGKVLEMNHRLQPK